MTNVEKFNVIVEGDEGIITTLKNISQKAMIRLIKIGIGFKMMDKQYTELMNALNYGFDYDRKLIIQWDNGLLIHCTSISGACETDTEPGDEDYIGEYSAFVGDVKVLHQGADNSVEIYNDCIEISLKCIPKKVSLEDGTVLWENKNNKDCD